MGEGEHSPRSRQGEPRDSRGSAMMAWLSRTMVKLRGLLSPCPHPQVPQALTGATSPGPGPAASLAADPPGVWLDHSRHQSGYALGSKSDGESPASSLQILVTSFPTAALPLYTRQNLPATQILMILDPTEESLAQKLPIPSLPPQEPACYSYDSCGGNNTSRYKFKHNKI